MPEGFNFSSQSGQALITILIYAIIIFGMYFIIFRPQRNKSKMEEEMRKNIKLGDDVITIGGIIGTVISVKEDSLVIESGSDKIRVKRWAISGIESKK